MKEKKIMQTAEKNFRETALNKRSTNQGSLHDRLNFINKHFINYDLAIECVQN